LGVGVLPAQTSRPSEDLLPETAKAFFAITDSVALGERWAETQIGQLMADPVMKPFAEDMKAQFQDRLSGLDKLGIKLDDLRGVAGGEIAVAMILLEPEVLPGPDRAAAAFLVDVTGHRPKADALLTKIAAELAKRNATRTQRQYAEQAVVQFEIPPPENRPDDDPWSIYYSVCQDRLVAASDLGVLQEIIDRLLTDKPGSLADAPAFAYVDVRCKQDVALQPNAQPKPQIRWFIDPVGYIKAARAALPEHKRPKGKTVIETLEDMGFDAVRGVGGYIDFSAEECEMVYRTAIYAPPPYENAMKILEAFGCRNGEGQPAVGDLTPQEWVPRDIAAYTTVRCDILHAFDNFGMLFDEIAGGEMFVFSLDSACEADLNRGALPAQFNQKFLGQFRRAMPVGAKLTIKKAGSIWIVEVFDDKMFNKPTQKDGKDRRFVIRKQGAKLIVREAMIGIWDTFRFDLEHASNGPKLKLRDELIALLGQRVTVLTDYTLPITPNSERLLVAIELKDADALSATIQRTITKSNPTAKHEVDGHTIWEILEEEPTLPEGIPGLPSLTPGGPPLGVPSVGGPPPLGVPPVAPLAQGGRAADVFARPALAVASGHLFVASHVDFLKKVLKSKSRRETLVSSPAFAIVDQKIAQMRIEGQIARHFSLTEEEVRPVYELIQQGKMPQSRMLLGQLLNAAFPAEDDTPREQRIRGDKLPDYAVVARALGPAGGVVACEPEGWFFKAFLLKKR